MFSAEENLINFVENNYPELDSFIKEWFSEDGKILMKTSGSTGEPKQITLSREHMINSARATAKFFDLESGSKALLCLPLGFIAGRMMLVRSMVLGWQLDVVESTSKPEISEDKIYDFSAMVPLQLNNSIDRLKNIKMLIVGGGEVSDSILNKIISFETKIYATYGMTETITHIALSPLNRSAGRKTKETIFRALQGVTLTTDHRECLVINAPHISSEEVVTNDIVDLKSEDSFKWLGRYDNVINSGGVKLIPEIIESRYKNLLNHEYFVTGIADKVLGEKLVLVIEGKEKVLILEQIHNIHKELIDVVQKYEIPKEIVFVKNFARTQTGKINRVRTIELLT